MADSKKLSFSTTTKSWAIVTKILQIGPWVSRINWREGHSFCSTYMVVRLSNVSSIYCYKRIFIVFCSKLSLRRTAWRPHELSKINALPINWSYLPEDQFLKFWRQLLSFWWWLKNSVKKKIASNLFKLVIVYGIPKDGTKFW